MLILIGDKIEEISPGQLKVYPFEVKNKYLILQEEPQPKVNTIVKERKSRGSQT